MLMARSTSPFSYEQLTGEIVFSYLTASITQSIILPRAEHQSRRFLKNNDTKIIFNLAKQLSLVDRHPSTKFEELEADLFFRFNFTKE